MNTGSKMLAAIAVASTLNACGGSGNSESDRQILGATGNTNGASSGIVSNDLGASAGQSFLLRGDPVTDTGTDLGISGVSVNDAGTSNEYTFTVNDLGATGVAADSLSIALEIAASGSFEDSFTTPLYDIREVAASDTGSVAVSGSLTMTARSANVDLPSGTYLARLVVNPNWQQSFDLLPENFDGLAFHFIAERDYSNNASGTFQIDISSSTVCEEDGFEDNDSLATATEIPEGGQISASLCLDDTDHYAVVLDAGRSTSLIFDYTDVRTNPNAATRYVVLDPGFRLITEPTVARESNRIVIDAVGSGQYYLILFGKRSSYRITRIDDGLADDDSSDSVFHADAISGPRSWLYGDIVLHRTAFTESKLNEQVVNCGRITTQFRDDNPVAYVTPSHFADIHEFRFLPGGSYIVDGEMRRGWYIADGDITNGEWYENDYPGYAERVANNIWRYWSGDGLAYVECTLEQNR